MAIQYPNNADYEKAIRKGTSIFNTLNDIEVIPSKTQPIQTFTYGAGAYAIVFKAIINNETKALRCFQSSTSTIKTRYEKIEQYFMNKYPSWYVKSTFINDEILINNSRHPVLLMNWVQGKQLNDYIDDIISDNDKLADLQKKLVSLLSSLERYKVGHGDIQTGNVFVEKKGGEIELSLVDYDNIYIPELQHLGSKENGYPQFQHPDRSKADYNHKIDRFSIWVCLTAIEAMKNDKSLWESKNQGGFNTGENMLFEGDDFKDPSNSRLFNKLIQYSDDVTTSKYAEYLKTFCSLDIDNIPKPRVINENSIIKIPASSKPIENLKVKSTKKTINISNEIKIQSNPTGATVLNNKLKKLGTTPLIIDRTLTENMILHLSLNNERKDIKIDNPYADIIHVDLKTGSKKVKSVSQNKVKGKHKKTSNVLKIIEFDVSPIGSSIVINDKGRVSTDSSCKEVFDKDEDLKVTISKQGYKTRSFDVLADAPFPYKSISLVKDSSKDWAFFWGIVAFVFSVFLLIAIAEGGRNKYSSSTNSTSTNSRSTNSTSISNYYPITITDVQFANGQKGGVLISGEYGDNLYDNDMRFLLVKLFFKSNIVSSNTLDLDVKLFKPDGSLSQGKDSFGGYTYSPSATIYSYDDEKVIMSWGNPDQSVYSHGTYKIEIWYNDRILFSKNLYIY